jgi:MFS family permease
LLNNGGSQKTLLYMSIFIFFISVGEGLTAPAIPLYGDLLGASYSQLGFLMTGYSITYALMTVFSGRISDHLGRKKILLTSIVLAFVASSGYYFSTTPIALLVFRTLEGMSRGMLWPVSEAIVADNTSYEDRGKAMGNFSAAYGGGVAIGTLAGGYIMQYISLIAVFPFYPLLAIIVFVAVFIGVQDTYNNISTHSSTIENIDKKNLSLVIKKIWPVCFVGFAYAGFLYTLWGLLSKVADVFGVNHFGIGVIFTLFWLSRLSSFILCGRAVVFFGRKKVLMSGILFCFISAGIYIVASGFPFFISAAILGGIGTGLIFPISITLVADLIHSEYRGFGMGFLELIMGIGMISQTAISGILGEFGGVQLTFLSTMIAMLVAVLISLFFIHEPKVKS